MNQSHDRARRTIRIGDVTWRVYETIPQLDRRRGPALIFDCVEIMRRVRTYPANWAQLDDATLIALCEGTYG